MLGNFFGGAFFGGGFFGELPSAEVPGGSSRRGKKLKKKKERVIRWADYAHSEDRAFALAKALAESATPLKTLSVERVEEPEDDDDALITALLLSRIIH